MATAALKPIWYSAGFGLLQLYILSFKRCCLVQTFGGVPKLQMGVSEHACRLDICQTLRTLSGCRTSERRKETLM